MVNNLISIIIPAYNAEKTIEECIDSIQSSSAEIIVVDDGSTDNTLDICKKCAKKNKNLRVISQKNKGPIEARYTGIQNASGEYIMSLDSDDFYSKNTIDRMVDLIKKYNKPDLIRFRFKKTEDESCQSKYFKDNEKLVSKEQFQELVYPMFLNGYMLNSLCLNCVKRNIYSEIKIDKSGIRLGEDLIVSLEIFSKINNALFIEDILYNYVYNSNSITKTVNKNELLRNLDDIIEVYTRIYKYLVRWDMFSEDNISILNDRFKCVTKKIINDIRNT